ncbi:hypothetical protein GUITHDRAFT_113352 [Guillardia theta CCMP2712]|uniref:Uncharacterized protein n=2 Tax=Guillardia theta TaxID=55529 RepID=L1IWF1_GUITC|nr:hypothetical protein GUITHDRAFT_113352 [Guillardia theta CCMP2712]EKX40566.1 hypothetical protein GUITHDRAFT_113352 [Guillardia theta CCMP2712]|eukprot:XP_005827546.1 hypothetical protein GUITHDRAFT_113352 [Guillardia theta CCMP2712]
MTPQWRGLVNGTVIYIALGIVALCFVVCISKPNKPLYTVSVILTTVCTWLLWACCYMSQMYPILYPMLGAAPGDGHGGGDHSAVDPHNTGH